MYINQWFLEDDGWHWIDGRDRRKRKRPLGYAIPPGELRLWWVHWYDSAYVHYQYRDVMHYWQEDTATPPDPAAVIRAMQSIGVVNVTPPDDE